LEKLSISSPALENVEGGAEAGRTATNSAIAPQPKTVLAPKMGNE